MALGAFTTAGDGRAHFSDRHVRPADAVPRSRPPAGSEAQIDDAIALVDFAHELEHLRGSVNEALTECVAVQDAAATGVALGVRRPARRRWRGGTGPTSTASSRPTSSPTPAGRAVPLDLDPVRTAWP
jgi:hypothetical protein